MSSKLPDPPAAATSVPTTDHVQWFDGLWTRLPNPLGGIASALTAIGMAAAATLIGILLSSRLPPQSIGLLYIPAVLLAAVALGTKTGLFVAVLSFLAFNFFFIPPVYTFTIADPQELFALVVFLAVALLTGSLAGGMREAADATRRRAAALKALNDFAADLAAAREERSIIGLLTARAAETMAGEAVFLARAGEDLVIAHSVPGEVVLGTPDWQAARHVLRSREPAFPSIPGWPGGRLALYPVMSGQEVAGVLGISPRDPSSSALDAWASVDLMLRHAGIAIERTRLEQAAVSARDETERERLRSALLSSLSHDLRTPLASITGAVTSLRELGSAMAPETRDDLLAMIEEEAHRLSSFVTNLLHMTRLESGGIGLDVSSISIEEIVHGAVARARSLKPAPTITVESAAPLPEIMANRVLLDSVVFNVLENAVKFTSDPAEIVVTMSQADASIILSITDTGRGISRAMQTRLFEPFFRTSDAAVPGMGLGLAIAKRVIEGMAGSIAIESPLRDGRGTKVTILLPAGNAPSDAGDQP